MKEVYCDYCGRRAEFVDSKVIYGKSYGMVYRCRSCDAYVGVHKGTDVPLGRLANAELRYWKKAALLSGSMADSSTSATPPTAGCRS